MKNLLSLFIILTLALSLSAQNLTFYPDKPSPGEEITIRYDPAGTPLAEAEEVEATAYLLEGAAPIAVEVALQKFGDLYTGVMASTPETKALFVHVSDKAGEQYDNNAEKGYRLKCYTKDKSAPVPEAYAVLAQAYGSWYRFMGMERDNERALEYMKKEFARNPEAKEEAMYLTLYATLSRLTKNEALQSEVIAMADALAAKRRASEEEWNRAYYLYLNLREKAKAEELAEKIRKKYKKGTLVREKMVRDFYNNTPKLEDRVALYEQFVKEYGDEEEVKQTISGMAGTIARGYGAEGDWDTFWSYMEKVDNPTSKAGTFNNLAWEMSGGGLEGETENLEMAEKLSAASLQLIKEEIETGANKPDYYTVRQWKERMQPAYGMYADTYALIVYHLGHYEEALQYQKIASGQDGFKNGEMNERYAAYYEKVKSAGETIGVLEDMIRAGTATTRMEKQHRRLFMEHYTLAEAYDKYMSELGKEAAAKRKEEIKKKMIDDPAPAFTLTDLEGREVSLEELKGKVVILDFWATWCGPCKASFPGMQQAVNKYADDPNVAFLFINAWESAKDKKKSAGDFIAQNEYTFRVLMDEKDEVIARYKVEGIPTKFIIGKNGRIRFKSVGYGGNNAELLKELELMIELAGSDDGEMGRVGD